MWRWTKSFDARVTEANGSRARPGRFGDGPPGGRLTVGPTMAESFRAASLIEPPGGGSRGTYAGDITPLDSPCRRACVMLLRVGFGMALAALHSKAKTPDALLEGTACFSYPLRAS